MNLFTAVVVEGAFEQSRMDAEVSNAYKTQVAKSSLPRIYELFKNLDLDNSGEITLHELHDAPVSALEEFSQFINLEDLDELFFILDDDGDGRLTPVEFFEGVSKLVASQSSMDSIRSLKYLEKQ